MRCIIADDEPPARERLARLLTGLADVEVVGQAADGVRALELVSQHRPDLLLLDIDMPELDGLAVAAALPADGPAVVFVTAYDEHALRAFELSAIDYLVKPVRVERLEAAIRKAAARRPRVGTELAELVARFEASRAGRRMALKCGARFLVFDPARVSAILARDHYSAVLVDGKELLADDSLDELAARFDRQQFVRIHRSAIIHLAFLRELVNEGDRRYVAVLGDPPGTRVPVSRERLPALKSALGLG
jgi:DNA-binding LytR/AlgR family response regulator